MVVYVVCYEPITIKHDRSAYTHCTTNMHIEHSSQKYHFDGYTIIHTFEVFPNNPRTSVNFFSLIAHAGPLRGSPTRLVLVFTYTYGSFYTPSRVIT